MKMEIDDRKQVRLHALVEGRVQGVGFRYFVEEKALGFGLTGWVRNRWDGSVEVVAEGERQTLEGLLSALRRGPRAAFVSTINHKWLPATAEFTRFSIRMTG
jgi:acylphosphatase